MSINRLPIGHLRTFLLVVDGAGVTAAIRYGVMTKTAVYNHIVAIETAVSSKLFEGGYKKENLTDIGKVTYKQSIEVVGHLDSIMSGILSEEVENGK